MRQSKARKRSNSIEKLKAIARGELPITALFNTQPVIIASHKANGDVHANGKVYSAEQWKEVVKRIESDSLALHEQRTILEFHLMGFKKDDIKTGEAKKPVSQEHNKPIEPPKIIDRYEKPQPKPVVSQAVIDAQQLEERMEELRKISNDDSWGWKDVPSFSGWLNSLGKR